MARLKLQNGFEHDKIWSVIPARRNSPRRRPSVLPRHEILEARITPTTSVWTGLGGDSLWSDATNWQGGLIPKSGDRIEFSAGTTNLAPIDDLPAGSSYKLIQIDAAGYDISGQPFAIIDGGITATYATGSSQLENSISYQSSNGTGSATFEVDGGVLTLSAGQFSISGPDHGSQLSQVIKTGAGTLAIASADIDNSAPTSVNAGTLLLQNSTVSGITATVTVNAGGTLAGDGVTNSVVSNGGTVGANFNNTTNILTLSTLSLDGSSTFSALIRGKTPGTGFNKYDQVDLSGSLTLGNATLDAKLAGTYVPVPGDKLTLVKGATSSSGTFKNLPEGSFVTLTNFSANHTYNFTISYMGGSSGHDVVLKTIQNSTVTPSGAPNPSTYNTSTTLNATVTAATGTPTGTVGFYYGASLIGTGTLVGGTTSISTSTLPTGADIITANYSGDSNTAPGTSAFNQNVGQVSTTTTVSGKLNPSTYGQSLALTANVTSTSGTPTGTISFMCGSTLLGTGTVNGSGVTTTSTSALPGGSDSVTAIYNGDTNFVTSNGSYSQTVNAGTTTTSLASAPKSTLYGQSILFTANVTPQFSGAPVSGTVIFKDGGNQIGTATLVNGVATLSYPFLTNKSHSVSAVYGGDSSDLGSTSNSVSQTVTQATSSTVVSANPNPSVFGQSVTLTATVSPQFAGTPTGTVQFFSNGSLLGSGTLAADIATIASTALATGSDTITAQYMGDSNFAGSTSLGATRTVNNSATNGSVSSSVNPSVFGQSTTLTATISAVAPGSGTPTGTVTFEDGSTVLGTMTLDGSGHATYATSSFAVGVHNISVIYAGDADFLGTTTTPYVQTVGQASTSVLLVSAANPSVFGQTATLTATVAASSPGAGTPTGTVTFFDGKTALGTGTLDASGVAVNSPSSYSFGTHQITAVYNGDTNFTTSTSNTVAQVVNTASSALALVTSTKSPVFGQPITYTVTASSIPPGSGTPTQSVDLTIDNVAVATISLSNGTGAYTTTTALSVGSHNVVATLNSDSDYNSSTNSLTQVVNQASSTANVSTITLNPFRVNPGTALAGEPVLIATNISPVSPGVGVPTGVVQFFDGTTLLGTGTLTPGIHIPEAPANYSMAIFRTTSLAVGVHNISVVYPGDASFTGSITPTTHLTINKAATTVQVTNAQPTPSTYGQSTSFTISVTPVSPAGGNPTGILTITDGSTILGTVPYAPVSGKMVFKTPVLGAGTHLITVTYSGDANFNGASNSTTQNVVAASTSTLIASSSPNAVYGQHITYTGVVVFPLVPGAETPNGTITFYNGVTPLGSGPVLGGRAILTVSAPSVGTMSSIKAVFTPADGNYIGSASAAFAQSVSKADSTLILFAQTFAKGVGFPSTTLAASPGSGNPTGTVSYYVNGALYGTQTLVNGMVPGYFFTTSAIRGKAVKIVYSGDANFNGGSNSQPIMVHGTHVKAASRPAHVFRARAAHALKHG